MNLLQEIREQPNGASFQRVDLHIHSYGEKGSKCVNDERMTPAGIVECAITKGVAAISITDHNRIGNVEEALSSAEGQDVLVVPGVELSTIQGHLLVYLETLEQLKRFYGKLDFDEDRTMCTKSITDCLNLAKDYDGFGVAAHIDRESGFETQMVSYNPAKKAIVIHPKLLAIEVADPENLNWFSSNDNKESRRSFFHARFDALQAHGDYYWPTVMFSDAHSLAAFTSAADNHRITRLKMDVPSFAGLRIALLDASSRVRTEESIPRSVPHIVGIRTDGGFLGKQTIHFNRNLNCIIGGRGTGKSTLLESLRVASGHSSRSTLVDSDAWPDSIQIVYEDETGNLHMLERRKGEPAVRNLSGSTDALTRVPTESYGQGETASRIQDCKTDPAILLEFLDSFVAVGALIEQDRALCVKLNEAFAQITAVEGRLKVRPRIVEQLSDTQKKVETLKREKVGELVQLEESLSEGRKFRDEVVTRLNHLLKSVADSLKDRQLFEGLLELEPISLVVGKPQLQRIREIVEAIQIDLDETEHQWEGKSRIHVKNLKSEIGEWKSQESKLENQIEAKRIELSEKGIEFDIKFIRKLTKDHAEYRSKLAELTSLAKQLEKLKKEHRHVAQERKRCCERISAERTAWAALMTKQLRSAVTDYEITIKFRSGKLSSDAAAVLKAKMEWRTTQVPRARLITECYSPFELIKIGKNSDLKALKEVVGVNGEPLLSKSDMDALLEILRRSEVIHQLEVASFDDLPEITVSKRATDAAGKEQIVTRDFTKLSLGQQQAVLLSILMFSKSRTPLIIDQPEDNLDNEFIYRTIVGNLKQVKEHRQVIVVTHNANIAVLGDSELIVPFKATSARAHVMARGSIDSDTTREMTCEILEGSEEAFRRRSQIYQLGSE